jgi:dephospho-CoA kinase
MTPQVAQQRVKAQSPQADKIAKADTVITNNDDLEALWRQVKGALKALVSGGAVQEEPEQVTRVKVEKRPEPQAAAPQQQQPAAAPQAEAMDVEEVEVTRGKPSNAEAIGQMLSQFVGHDVSRTDVMMAFGEKAYLLAESEGTQLGLVGMLVENLITRVDEFYIIPGAPTFSVAKALIESIEQNSKDLQSEVGFIFLPEDTPQETRTALESKGYERFTAQTIKVPAWREAIQDSQPPGTLIFGKKLRDDLVLKPL